MMSGQPFINVPANTVLTTAGGSRFNGTGEGSIGLSVVDGQLCVAIAEDGTNRVMVARMHHTALDEFCALLADHLPSVVPEGAAAELEAGSCSTRH